MFAFLLWATLWSAARACGGFFCSNAQPVVQTAERIAFFLHEADAAATPFITMHVQISYTGDAAAFSWVLPLPSTPDIALGNDALFAQLDARSQPSFAATFRNSSCAFRCGRQAIFRGDAVEAQADQAGGDSGPNVQVQVLGEGSVGSFDYQIVFDPSREGSPMFEWLNDNGYDQPPSAEPIVKKYAAMANVFLALKLQKTAEVGDLAPVVLEFEVPSPVACVPLALTAIATADELPVLLYVFASGRVVPLSHFDVQPDWRGFDTFNCAVDRENPFGRNIRNAATSCSSGFENQYCLDSYNAVVQRAVEEAEGHAFVTEYAGSSERFHNIFDDDGGCSVRLDQFARIKSSLLMSESPSRFIRLLSQAGIDATTPGMSTVLRSAFPFPADRASGFSEFCRDESTFRSLSVLANSEAVIDGCINEAGIKFEPKKLVSDIEQRIIKPLDAARKLIKSMPYATRMFSGVKAEKMDVDVFMSIDKDADDVSEVVEFDVELQCEDEFDDRDAVFTLHSVTNRDWSSESATAYSFDSPLISACIPAFGGDGPTQSHAEQMARFGGGVAISAVRNQSLTRLPSNADLAANDAENQRLAMPECDGEPVKCAGGFEARPMGPDCGTVCPTGGRFSGRCIDCEDIEYSRTAVPFSAARIAIISVISVLLAIIVLAGLVFAFKRGRPSNGD